MSIEMEVGRKGLQAPILDRAADGKVIQALETVFRPIRFTRAWLTTSNRSERTILSGIASRKASRRTRYGGSPFGLREAEVWPRALHPLAEFDDRDGKMS